MSKKDLNANITVVGGINVDIEARSDAPLIPRDSNPGKTSVSLGGVGFNIARDLSLLGGKVRMLTAIAPDAHRERIVREAEDYGIDLSEALSTADGTAPSYVYICGPDGDMALAVHDGELLHRVDAGYLEEHLGTINGSACVVLDANLDEDAIVFLAENCRVHIFADPVSVTKSLRMKTVLPKIFAMKPNRHEAEALTGIWADDPENAEKAVRSLNDQGVEHVFLSMGSKGLCYGKRGGGIIYRDFTAPGGFFAKARAAIKDTTGGGDAMMAAIVRAWQLGMTAEQAIDLAAAAALMTVQQPGTVNKELSLERILEMSGMAEGPESRK